MSVQFIRMRTGENIVAEVDMVTSKTVCVLHYPIYVGIDNSYNQSMLSMIEWIPQALVDKPTFAVSRSDIMVIANPSAMMEKSYLEFVEKMRNNKNNLTVMDEDEQLQEQEDSEINLNELENIVNLLRNKVKRTYH